MQGQRFILGIFAGVLLGLAVVVPSGFVAFGTFGSFSAGPSPASLNKVSTTMSSSTTSIATSSGAVPAYTTNSTVSATASTTSSSQTSTSQGPYDLVSSASAATPHASRLDSIVAQPILVTGFVLLPVLVALLFGLVLYTTSSASRRKD